MYQHTYPAVVSNDGGEFRISVTGGGRHALWIRRLGYNPKLLVLDLTTADSVDLGIQLVAHVVDLEGVTVYGISATTEGQREFWSRRDLPWNQSVDYTEIERLHV